jgi:DNA-binding NarL/FixJ family response regulator
MTILIADDDEVVRREICRILLRETECEICEEAEDGLDAIEKAQQLHPDLIIVDLDTLLAASQWGNRGQGFESCCGLATPTAIRSLSSPLTLTMTKHMLLEPYFRCCRLRQAAASIRKTLRPFNALTTASRSSCVPL